MIKNTLFALILIIFAGGLSFIGINNRNDNNVDIKKSVAISVQPSSLSLSTSLPTREGSENDNASKIEKQESVLNNNEKSIKDESGEYKTLKSYTYFFLPPAPVTTSPPIEKNQQEILLNQSPNEIQYDFESWKDAVESQGYSFNDTKTMDKLKSVRLEFQTLAEIKETGADSLNLHIYNIKDFIRKNSETSVEFSDNMLLGDLWEKLFEIDIEVEGISPELKQRYIESFYNIPITLEKELEIAEISEKKSISGEISKEKEEEIKKYLASQEYAELEEEIGIKTRDSFNFEDLFNKQTVKTLLNTLFAPIGSEREEHSPTDAGYPTLAGQCGGNTRVSEFPPGYNTFATCCSGCPSCSPCRGVYCDCICGCNPPVAYIWDAVTGICGCGE